MLIIICGKTSIWFRLIMRLMNQKGLSKSLLVLHRQNNIWLDYVSIRFLVYGVILEYTEIKHLEEDQSGARRFAIY